MHANRYTFHGHNGYLIHPRTNQADHTLLALGHTDALQPWRDPVLHAHTASEELYCLLGGELRFLVDGMCIDLLAGEILLVRAGIPHAILGGRAPIEHLGLRAPALQDKIPCGEIPLSLPEPLQAPRTIQADWGARLPLAQPEHQNTWLIGGGTARVISPHLSLVYLDFHTLEAANAGIGTRHRPHYHRLSWEYYLVLQGEKTLQVEAEQVALEPGELLEVPPGVAHTLSSRQAPFRGFTLRVPALLDDKVELTNG